MGVEIDPGAHKHGVSSTSIAHAIDNAVAYNAEARRLSRRPEHSCDEAPTMTKTHGKAAEGTEITDEVIERLGAEAEAGYDVDKLKPGMRRGRPPMGSAAAEALPVRLDPELRASVVARAEHDGVAQGEIVRRALRQYLAS